MSVGKTGMKVSGNAPYHENKSLARPHTAAFALGVLGHWQHLVSLQF